MKIREKCALGQATSVNRNDEYFIQGRKPRPPSSTSALFSDSSENYGGLKCLFCKGNHRAYKCHVVTDHSARRQILSKQGRCFICLKNGHLSRNCSSQIKCYDCKQRHHSSICKSFNRGQDYEATPEKEVKSSTTEVVSQESESTTNMHVSSKNAILLQTAKAKAKAPNNSAEVDISS